nr:putative isoaspartyl peptidase/l-asparaginase [Quercus suber]
MEYSLNAKPEPVTPRIIIHGGAGNITRSNLLEPAYQIYRHALLTILEDAHAHLSKPGSSALDIATYAVSLLENDSLFNSGRGAVYTTAGTHELEASVMVSKGYRKRGVGVMKVTRARNPIKLARELLVRGETDDGGGAGQHVQLHGETIDRLAEEWGLECVTPSYFWTRKRWDEHRRGMGLEHSDETYKKHKKAADGHDGLRQLANDECPEARWNDDRLLTQDACWNGRDYLPQGTVGAVVLDSTGTLCVATSTGGLTNKLPGRIGDTPTLGAGFFAEQWHAPAHSPVTTPTSSLCLSSLHDLWRDCLPSLSAYTPITSSAHERSQTSDIRATAMSGTGNGDSFLRISAVRTASAMARFSLGYNRLQTAVTAVAGPNGMLQQSAGEHWKKTGEGEGGIIGIELTQGKGVIVADFNCGGMFRAWVDDHGNSQMRVFREAF